MPGPPTTSTGTPSSGAKATCASSPQLLCLAGRTGTTNDPTISSDSDGTITGSAASGKRLLLQANPLQDAPIAIEYPGVRASYTDGPNEQIYEAGTDATANNITVTIVSDGPSQPLSVSVVGQAVTIHLATDGGGVITTTVGDLFTFINTDPTFAAVPPGGMLSVQVPSFDPTDLASTLVTQSLRGFSSGGAVRVNPSNAFSGGRLTVFGGDPTQATLVVEGAGAGQTANLAQVLCNGYGLVVTAKGIVQFINDDNEHVTEWYANDGVDLAFQMDGDGTARFLLSPVVVSDLGGGGLRPVFADNAGTLVPGSSSGVGPPGMDGLDGVDGLDGMPGPQGATGATGSTGATGPQGFPGMDGLDGLDGMDGLTGSTGPMGATGATGAQGIQGLPGLDGLDGTDGLDGLTGSTGPQGQQGIQGATGFDGADGADGLDGLTGSTGPQGIQGIAGAIGFDGADGADGFDGLSGSTGPQGPQGIIGPSGVDGADGADGLDGLTGSTGPQGIQGIIGPADLAYDPSQLADEPFWHVQDLSQYWYLPGRTGGQRAAGGTATSDSATIVANSATWANTNTGRIIIDDRISLMPTSRTGIAANPFNIINIGSGAVYEMTGAGVNPILFNFSGEVKLSAAPSLGLSPAVFACNGTFRAATSMTTIAPQLVTNSGTLIADGAVWTLSSLFGAIADAPGFSSNAGGSFAGTYASFTTQTTVNTFAVLPTRIGYLALDGSGGGAITTQVAYDVGTWTKGTATNISYRSQTAGAYAQHLGAVVQGQDPGSFTIPTGYFAQFPTLILATGEVATVQGTGILQVH